MEKELKIDSELSDVQNLFFQDKLDLAFKKIDRIIKSNKRNYLPLNYRGILFLKIGNHQKALVDFKKSVLLNKDFALGFNNIALCYQALGNIKQAIEFYERSIALDSESIEAKINLGSLYLDLNKFTLAIINFKSVLDLSPFHEHAHQLLADAYIKIAKYDLALSLHLKAKEINPTNFFNYYLLGSDYLWSGNKEIAGSYFMKAIELNPNHSESYYGLSRVKKTKPHEPIFFQASELLNNENTIKSDKVFLNFFMANIYEDVDHALFFKYLNEGNRLKKEINNFCFDSLKALSTNLMGFFLNHLSNITPLPTRVKNSIDEIIPIFIVGMPRSGTSLLEQVLSNDDKIFGAGEIGLIHSTFTKIMSSENPDNDFTNKLIDLRQNYLSNIKSMTDKKIFTDKLPLNFFWLGFIKKMFPHARIIHIERNPIATSFSIYRTLFAHGSLDFSYSQDDIISFYDLYKSFMIFWDAHLPNLICHVNYERLVKNPRDEFALIFNYLNLPFDEKVLELQANKRSVLTASDLQIRRTIYDGSSNSWVKYEGEIQKFTQAFKT